MNQPNNFDAAPFEFLALELADDTKEDAGCGGRCGCAKCVGSELKEMWLSSDEAEGELNRPLLRGAQPKLKRPTAVALRAVRPGIRALPTTSGEPVRFRIGGYPSHQHLIASLSMAERAKIQQIADQITASYRRGARRVTGVRIIGFADRDFQGGQPLEHKVSTNRAVDAKKAITARLGSPTIAQQITWEVKGVGATRLIVPNPRTEGERMRNRRLEIVLFFGPNGSLGLRRSFLRVRDGGLVGTGFPANAGLTASARQGLVGPQSALTQLPRNRQNIREDVLHAMARLRSLRSLTDAEFATENPRVLALAPGASVDFSRLPGTSAAIRRNQDPTLHHLVARNFLNQPLTQPVGRGQPNLQADVLLLQHSLHALKLLAPADFNAENAAVRVLARVDRPEQVMPKTLSALTELKDRIAGFDLGWRPLHPEEIEAGGDRFGGRTFEIEVSTLCFHAGRREAVESHGVSLFLPRGISPNINKVHVFFSPRGVIENPVARLGGREGNDVLIQGLRSACDTTDWILIGVSGISEAAGDGWRTIDDAAIKACLKKVGRSEIIESVRLSGHSRGVMGLNATLGKRKIGVPVDRVVVLDAPELIFVRPRNLIVYRVNVRKDVPGAIVRDLDPGCMRAIGFTRLIEYAKTRRQALTIPPEIERQLLRRLPARGCLTTARGSLVGCQTNLAKFCTDNTTAIQGIVRNEGSVGGRTPEGLHHFCELNNLLLAGHPVKPSIYSHHVFVAEIAHEFTSA